MVYRIEYHLGRKHIWNPQGDDCGGANVNCTNIYRCAWYRSSKIKVFIVKDIKWCNLLYPPQIFTDNIDQNRDMVQCFCPPTPHPPWQWWSVVHIPATLPSHINHGNHKELGLIRLEIKCFWFKRAIRLYNFSICRHWCQKRCLICDKRIMTKHSTYCARQMPNATWKNWKNRTEHYVVD